jgi:hypothetical protein
MNKVLILASGPSVQQVNEYDYKSNGWTIVAVNNACHAYENFDYWVYPRDFCGERPKLNDHQKEIKEEHYLPALENHGGLRACVGAGSITIGALYWALDALKPGVIAVLGSDMNYDPGPNGETAFYGVGYDIKGKTRSKGKPDPFFQAARSPNKGTYPPGEFMIYLFARFMVHAKNQNTRVVNFSTDSKTILPYIRLSPDEI